MMTMIKKKPELLAPAGDMERLQMALAYGADAVYLAGNAFGMRAFAGTFDRATRWPATMRWPDCPNIWNIWIPSG